VADGASKYKATVSDRPATTAESSPIKPPGSSGTAQDITPLDALNAKRRFRSSFVERPINGRVVSQVFVCPADAWLRTAARWEHSWGGNFALTLDHLPHIHNPAAGLYAAAECNGRGVAMLSQIGRLIADLAAGNIVQTESPIPITPVASIPFHPLRRPERIKSRSEVLRLQPSRRD
jgi:hypothetical protein